MNLSLLHLLWLLITHHSYWFLPAKDHQKHFYGQTNLYLLVLVAIRPMLQRFAMTCSLPCCNWPITLFNYQYVLVVFDINLVKRCVCLYLSLLSLSLLLSLSQIILSPNVSCYLATLSLFQFLYLYPHNSLFLSVHLCYVHVHAHTHKPLTWIYQIYFSQIYWPEQWLPSELGTGEWTKMFQ